MPTYHVKVRQGDLEVEATADDKKFVLAQVERFFPAHDSPSKDGGTASQPSTQRTRQSGSGGKPVSLLEFRNEVNPESAKDHVLCAAYYLEKYGSHTEFAPKQVYAGLREMKLSVKNPSDALLKARSAGYLMPGSTKGHLMLSTSGEKYVEELRSRRQAKAKE